MTMGPKAARVLMVSGLQIYPTLSGGNLRSFSLANALAQRGFEVFVYSFVGRKADYLARQPSGIQTWPGGVDEYVNRSRMAFLAGYGSYWLGLPPLWLSVFIRAASRLSPVVMLPRLLREKLTWCDAVIADFPFLYPIFATKEARDRYCVLNTHNVEHHLYEGKAGRRNTLLRAAVRRIELAAATTADVLVSCSESDQRYFERRAAVQHSVIVPNGIDPERFRIAGDARATTRAVLGIPDDGRVFLFTASKWGPNKEAFDFLCAFARTHEQLLLNEGIHLLVVGNVVPKPMKLPGLTATGSVERVEPYFEAADAAINPIVFGAGTNVKMGEFMAAHLPVVVSAFGARGYRIEDGRTGFVFERENLWAALVEARRLFDKDLARVRRIANDAYHENADRIDMRRCVEPLVQILKSYERHDKTVMA